jgi:hypothetical protein
MSSKEAEKVSRASGSSLTLEDRPQRLQQIDDVDAALGPERRSSTATDRDIERCDSALHQPPTNDGRKEQNNLVEFDGPDDAGNPKNWSKRKRWGVTVSMGLMTFVVTFASSIFSVAIKQVAEEYHVGTVVATLGVSLFLMVSGHDI